MFPDGKRKVTSAQTSFSYLKPPLSVYSANTDPSIMTLHFLTETNENENCDLFFLKLRNLMQNSVFFLLCGLFCERTKDLMSMSDILDKEIN